MDPRTLKILEYNRILEMLTGLASSPMARRELEALTPLTEATEIEDALRETSEARTVLLLKGAAPLGQIYDIAPAMSLAQKGGTLTMSQLLQILYNLRVAVNVTTFLKGDLPPLPVLSGIREVIVTFPRLIENIDRCIISEDEMADNASPALRDIRRGISRQNDSIRNRLNAILNSTANRTYLQDAIVTVRDGRYVIPVKAEHRSRFPGIVHDQSATGATLFIEPQVIVNMNNELRELELKEQAEIERILAALSSACAEHYHEIINNQKLLTMLDVIFAKGKLSQAMDGEEPQIVQEGALVLKEARHPLIDKKKVVPVDMQLGGAYDTLVITGPNTGGKTVTLKTTGLLVLMAQSGLHIPAASTSVVPVFDRVFADIGDEQSIEQSLSTFSSHMRNLVSIIKSIAANPHERTLVLLDELGAGTDPTEGAALAISILESLKDYGACTVATTHYNELKKYALSTDRVENGSMEFDVETLSPTYRLMIGVPGKSNAFEISRKLGLAEDIIARATRLLERGDIEFEDVISAIEADKKYAASERDEAEALKRSIKQQKLELDRRQQELEKKEAEIIGRAKEEARELIREAKETASDVSRELRALNKAGSLSERNRRFDRSRQRLKEAEERFAEKKVRRVNQSPVSPAELKVGDKVRVLTLDQPGEVLTLPDSRGDLSVQVGIMKVSINVNDLMCLETPPPEEKSKGGRYGSLYKAKAQNISISVNVQGENLDDALMDVEKYLDDAYMAGLHEVTVIHGRGEGILKEGLRRMMRKNKHVASFRKGNYNEGGDGVTIVTLKE